jgi:hypothetical protein
MCVTSYISLSRSQAVSVDTSEATTLRCTRMFPLDSWRACLRCVCFVIVLRVYLCAHSVSPLPLPAPPNRLAQRRVTLLQLTPEIEHQAVHASTLSSTPLVSPITSPPMSPQTRAPSLRRRDSDSDSSDVLPRSAADAATSKRQVSRRASDDDDEVVEDNTALTATVSTAAASLLQQIAQSHDGAQTDVVLQTIVSSVTSSVQHDDVPPLSLPAVMPPVQGDAHHVSARAQSHGSAAPFRARASMRTRSQVSCVVVTFVCVCQHSHNRTAAVTLYRQRKYVVSCARSEFMLTHSCRG